LTTVAEFGDYSRQCGHAISGFLTTRQYTKGHLSVITKY